MWQVRLCGLRRARSKDEARSMVERNISGGAWREVHMNVAMRLEEVFDLPGTRPA